MLKETGRESLVLLYSPAMDRTFSALCRKADHIIEIAPDIELQGRGSVYGAGRRPRDGRRLPQQRTLEMI